MKKILFLLFTINFASILYAQHPNDCENAIIICGNSQFKSNATGIGNIQEISSCNSGENNSLWLEINIVQGGTLGFDLIPNSKDLVVDYDFWVFGPNTSCNDLGMTIRCSTTNPIQANLTSNHTGIDGSNTEVTEGNGSDGIGYVQWLNVLPGEKYYIAIDRPHGDGGFTVNWTGTANQGNGAFPIPPLANQLEEVSTCSETSFQEFNLDDLRADINPNLSETAITFYETEADAFDGIDELPDKYTNTVNPQVIYAKATSIINFCFTIVEVNLAVYKNQKIGALNDLYACDQNKDGSTLFNLRINEEINASFTTTYYVNEEDAYNKKNAINIPGKFYNTREKQTIWLRQENNNNENCFDIGSFNLNVYQDAPPQFDLTKKGEEFGEKPKIIVENIEGIGPYEFRLNDQEWIKLYDGQTSLVFPINQGGEHLIEGRHVEGCGNKKISAIFLDYPKFFTPNGDGYNEYWNVEGAANLRFKSEIYIFDRFGKLLRSIDPKGLGWDGFYNGKPMPAGDYWFLFEYEQLMENGKRKQKEFKSNITLLR